MSDKSQKREQQMIEMQTRFDVNKLELEKSKLANKNKQIALTGTFILLLAAIGWSIYQRTMVKRLKRKMHCALMTAHEEVRKQSMKATESEKMKTAFLNSICHEIRTPLNSIAGFSELIFDESLDTATRQEFRQLIQSNSTALASLMDNMLEPVSLCQPPNCLFLWSLPTYTDYVLKKWPNLRKLCPSRTSNVSSQAIKTE